MKTPVPSFVGYTCQHMHRKKERGSQQDVYRGHLGTICIFNTVAFYHKKKINKNCLIKCKIHQEGNKTETRFLYYSWFSREIEKIELYIYIYIHIYT